MLQRCLACMSKCFNEKLGLDHMLTTKKEAICSEQSGELLLGEPKRTPGLLRCRLGIPRGVLSTAHTWGVPTNERASFYTGRCDAVLHRPVVAATQLASVNGMDGRFKPVATGTQTL